MSRRYRLPRLPAIAMAIAIPLGAVMLITLADIPIRRDLGLLAAVAVVIVLAWAGGIWPGLVATLLMVALFAGGVGENQFAPPLDDLSLLLFVTGGLVGTGVVESLHRTRWRVEAARDRARLARRSEHAIRAELESIVAAIGEGIVVVNAAGTISLMNQAAIDLVGRRPDTLPGLLQAFERAEGGMPVEGLEDLANANGPVTTDLQLAGGDRRIELASFPLAPDGELPPGRVILLRDVTEARRRELLREAFLSLLSHELRTPMTAVYGGATLMQRVGDQLDPATRNEIRADIVAEAERLSKLIDDLLVLTRVEGGVEVGLEPALLQHLVAEVVAQDQRAFGASRITLSLDAGLPPVIGDDTSIRQVVHNLISNAVKYSPGASAVDVRVEATESEVEVRILDRGRGLSTDDAAHIFEAFYRGRTTEQMAPGIGIGLYVCQRLVDAMGGRIWGRGREGGGSEFGFALQQWPVENDDQETEPAAEPEEEPRAAAPAGTTW